MEMKVAHKGTQPLNTKRLTLRRLEPTDVDNMYKNWASDPDVTRYLTWQTHENIETTQGVVKMFVDGYSNVNYYLWAVVPNFGRYQGEVIGTFSVVDTNDEIGWCEIGYCLAHEYWGMGVASEAVQAMIEFLLFEVGYNRIQAKHHIDNPASGAVMKKCGMTYEGTLRDYYRDARQNICTVSLYSILRREYNN